MPGGFGLTELLVVLAIVLLIFGPRRLKSIGADLEPPSRASARRSRTTRPRRRGLRRDPDVIEGEVTSGKAEAKQETHV